MSFIRNLILQLAINEENIPENQRTINLVLRMRNTKRELNDIRFEFQPSKVGLAGRHDNLSASE